MSGIAVPAMQKRDDALTTVMKGLQIARDVYGIKSASDQGERAEAADKRTQQAFDSDTSTKAFAAKGGLTPLQKATLQTQGAQFDSKESPGATPVFIGTPDQSTPMFMTVRQAKQPRSSVKEAVIGGKVGTATYDPEQVSPSDPNAGLVQFVETKQRPVIGREGPGEKRLAKDETDAWSDFTRLGTDLNVENKSSRSAIGVAANKLQGADRVLGLADVSPQELAEAKQSPEKAKALEAKLDKLTPQKKSEIVNALMSQVATGTGSLSQFEHLNAATADERIANLMQYFSAHPVGAQSGGLLLDNLMSIKNERDISQKRIGNYIERIQKAHPRAFSHAATKDAAEALFEAWTKSAQDELDSDAAATATAARSAPSASPPAASGSGTAQAAGAGTTPFKPGSRLKVGGVLGSTPDGIHFIPDDSEAAAAIPPERGIQ